MIGQKPWNRELATELGRHLLGCAQIQGCALTVNVTGVILRGLNRQECSDMQSSLGLHRQI